MQCSSIIRHFFPGILCLRICLKKSQSSFIKSYRFHLCILREIFHRAVSYPHMHTTRVETTFPLGECHIKGNCRYYYQRFVSSIGNIEKAMRVFNCLGRSAWFGQSEIILQTDNNFPMYDNFQIDFQKITQIRKSWAPLFSNQKKEYWF